MCQLSGSKCKPHSFSALIRYSIPAQRHAFPEPVPTFRGDCSWETSGQPRQFPPESGWSPGINTAIREVLIATRVVYCSAEFLRHPLKFSLLKKFRLIFDRKLIFLAGLRLYIPDTGKRQKVSEMKAKIQKQSCFWLRGSRRNSCIIN